MKFASLACSMEYVVCATVPRGMSCLIFFMVGSGLNYVLLKKRSRNICRAKVHDVPSGIKIPSVWSITTFVPVEKYQQNDFLKFSLVPDPEDDNQTNEWGRFMCYLRKSGKACAVKLGSVTFHILYPGYSVSAMVLYETKLKDHGVCKNVTGNGMYGRSNTSEETCDNIPHIKEMEFSCKHHNSYITEPHGFVPESSRFNSVENGPRFLDPEVKKKTSTLARNFVKTNPRYLRTLGQTHAGWIFGAVAELVDNSRDAGASRLDISIQSMFSKKEKGKVPVLCVSDDGLGMTYEEMMRMVSFGHDGANEHCKDQIGRFGIGFKSGSMKLGKDALVLTQTSTSRSVSFLSQSFNDKKDNIEIPVVTYCKEGQYMEVDLNVQSKATAERNLDAIKEFSPFNEYFIGEKVGLFGEEGTGTQVYIWNLEKWGADYTLEWNPEKINEIPAGHGNGDILIRSKRVRSRPGQRSGNVPLDYSLKAYLEVMFLNPQMKITVQGSPVITRHLEKKLDETSVMSGEIKGRTIRLTLGLSYEEWDRVNCGMFLYWHGRLIESYKRVGGQQYNADAGRGIIGVADVTDLIDNEDGSTWVLNSKQGFQDCEMYVKLEEWLGRKADQYWDRNFDKLELREDSEHIEAVDDWVQCNSCRKWRVLSVGFDKDCLPSEWFCYMPPFNGKCEIPEKEMEVGVIAVGAKRSGDKNVAQPKVQRLSRGEDVKNLRLIPPSTDKKEKGFSDARSCKGMQLCMLCRQKRSHGSARMMIISHKLIRVRPGPL
ncbi:ATPase MORC2A-like isoform X4 [Hordeum vulgare subsp. vulgare]|uniref:ATPase MORC2A-like isoform X4 n=1 Tax=Hordeum vulgare subsp. vulgare TaxID=112509 RepID=UPI001D1A4CA8|nr:ATPase MORC2A-like isoform X4 [Hordeum vulgare subsp. vulgare]